MRPEVIVILSPVFDLLSGVVERQESVGVEAFVTESADAMNGLSVGLPGRE